MHPQQAEKVERFKSRIDFDNAFQGDDPMEIVRAHWPNMSTAPGLAGTWPVVADTTWYEKNGVARQWTLRKGAQVLDILIFVSSEGVEPSREFLLSRASENMMVDVPYAKGPPGLGTFAISSPNPKSPSLIWVYRNICFHLRVIDSHLDILPIARWLQSVAQASTGPGEKANMSADTQLEVSARHAPVGEPIVIRLQDPSDEGRYFIELEYDNRTIEVLSQERIAVTLKGLLPGTVDLIVRVIDKETLLSSSQQIGLKFVSDDSD